MTDKELFSIVGRDYGDGEPTNVIVRKNDMPYKSVIILLVIIMGCIFADVIAGISPDYIDLNAVNEAPGSKHFFGTDSLGRDIFSLIWHGGRVSVVIGIASTIISAFVAVIYGSLCCILPRWADTAMMRFAEIVASIPSLLMIVFLQAILGGANVLSLSFVIGITSWPALSRVIRTEVLQIINSEYIIASKCMGGNYFHILFKHMIPNFIPSVMFMVVMNVRNAIITEATLSFIGIGLPLETVSLGSMLSLADNAVLSNYWWIIVIPGVFLITLLFCITNIGNYIRERNNSKHRYI